MKMLIATTVAEYREKLEQFFSVQNVPFYNEFEIKGVEKSAKAPHRVDNWFGKGRSSINNIAFFTMIDDEQADNIMIDLMNCKRDMPNCNIHAYILNVEQGV